MSRQGVRENQAQRTTSKPPSGMTTSAPAVTTTNAIQPSGPQPRRARARRSRRGNASTAPTGVALIRGPLVPADFACAAFYGVLRGRRGPTDDHPTVGAILDARLSWALPGGSHDRQTRRS